MGVEAFEHGGEITTRKAPVERTRRYVVALFEAPQAVGQSVEVGEVGWLDDLALNDGEDDLDLVQPRGVHRKVDEVRVGPCSSHALDRALPTV